MSSFTFPDKQDFTKISQLPMKDGLPFSDIQESQVDFIDVKKTYRLSVV